jgi:hypothetical protein
MITALVVCLDDFSKTFAAWKWERPIPSRRKRRRAVCPNPRMSGNRAFQGHISMSWFYAFKVHVVMSRPLGSDHFGAFGIVGWLWPAR